MVNSRCDSLRGLPFHLVGECDWRLRLGEPPFSFSPFLAPRPASRGRPANMCLCLFIVAGVCPVSGLPYL